LGDKVESDFPSVAVGAVVQVGEIAGWRVGRGLSVGEAAGQTCGDNQADKE